eukprot:GHRR01026399.1.p1 GENE.GHRR01026399.1~~GHRR01026399.1.p1  ORF type:complete len:186 (+),score=36.23 GHRR01026399.1:750-1307(+)
MWGQHLAHTREAARYSCSSSGLNRVTIRTSRRRQLVFRAAQGPKPPKQQMLVYVPPHPLVKHWLAVARNAATPSPIFRNALAELGRILIYEAVREFLPTVDGVVDTPMGPAEVTCVDPMQPVKVCVAMIAASVVAASTKRILDAQSTLLSPMLHMPNQRAITASMESNFISGNIAGTATRLAIPL